MEMPNFFSPQLHVFSVDVYDVDVVFAINLSGTDVTTKIKNLNPSLPNDVFHGFEDWKPDEEGCAGRLGFVAGGYVVLITAKEGLPNRFFNTLSHEISHLTTHILRDRGIDHIQETDEAYAYLTGYLTQQMWELLGHGLKD